MHPKVAGLIAGRSITYHKSLISIDSLEYHLHIISILYQPSTPPASTTTIAPSYRGHCGSSHSGDPLAQSIYDRTSAAASRFRHMRRVVSNLLRTSDQIADHHELGIYESNIFHTFVNYV